MEPQKPSVGRVVHYRNSELSDQPCAALVVYVWSESCVNLAVFDSVGNSVGRTSVLLADGENTELRWSWPALV